MREMGGFSFSNRLWISGHFGTRLDVDFPNVTNWSRVGSVE